MTCYVGNWLNIKEPITFRGYDFCYTPAQAVEKHIEDFIMEIMKQNLKK